MDIVEQSWAILNLSVLTGETLQISKPGNVIACMIPRMFRAILQTFLTYERCNSSILSKSHRRKKIYEFSQQ